MRPELVLPTNPFDRRSSSRRLGDEFVVGNGEVQRGRFRMVERDGTVGVERLDSSWSLSDLWDEALSEAESLLAEEDD